MKTDVLIVGAGPTGLVLALCLTRLGVRTRIIDRNAGPGETSRAFAVHARTLELYDQLGLAKPLRHIGRELSAVTLHDRRETVSRVPFGDFGRDLSPFPFILILLQDKHEKFLLGRLAEAGVEVERNTELVEFQDDGARVLARLVGPDGAMEPCEAAYLCGCDGVDSTVRDAIGALYWGGTYDRLFYVADVIASGRMVDGEVHYAMAGADLCRVFPLLAKDSVRLIGRAPSAGASGGATPGFEDVALQVSEATGLKIAMVEWYSTYLVHHRVADRFRRGRAFILGDACHTHSPALSQGLNTGIGDAVNLAWKLGAVLRDGADPALLDTYESERRAVARRIVGTTDLAFGLQVEPSRYMRAIRRGLARLAPALMRLSWFRSLVFRTVSQTALNYRTSALSRGGAGLVRGGDRLPWVRLAGSRDNFEPLRALGWQAHVYGRATARFREMCVRRGLPLYEFPWSETARRAELTRDAAYLIRPDGYLAYASGGQDPNGVEQLLTKFNLHPRAAAGEAQSSTIAETSRP